MSALLGRRPIISWTCRNKAARGVGEPVVRVYQWNQSSVLITVTKNLLWPAGGETSSYTGPVWTGRSSVEERTDVVYRHHIPVCTHHAANMCVCVCSTSVCVRTCMSAELPALFIWAVECNKAIHHTVTIHYILCYTMVGLWCVNSQFILVTIYGVRIL